MIFNNNRRISLFVWLFACAFVVAPFCITIVFSIPFSDDYATAAEVLRLNGNNVLNAFIVTTNKYFTWAGGWPFNLPQFLLNPLILFPNKLLMYGFELVMFFLIFVIVCYFYIKVICRYVFNLRNIIKIRYYYLLILFTFLNTAIYNDVFYWFVGNSYLWEATFCLLNQILIILYFRKNFATKYLISLCIVGFVACFAYQFAILSGLLFIFEYYGYYKNNQHHKIQLLVPLLIMIIAGLLSCFAPGNFIRQAAEASVVSANSTTTSSFFKSILKASFRAFNEALSCHIKLLTQPFVILSLVLTFYLGLKSRTQYKYISPLVIFFAEIISIILICFPIAFGYSSAALPNRAIFMINFSIYFSFNYLMFFTGREMQRYNNITNIVYKSKSLLFVGLVIIMFTMLFQFNKDNMPAIYDQPWFRTALNIENVVQESAQSKQTIYKIQTSTDKDVVIDGKTYPFQDGGTGKITDCGLTTDIIRKFVLTENPTHIINKEVAFYYGKDSVRADLTSCKFFGENEKK